MIFVAEEIKNEEKKEGVVAEEQQEEQASKKRRKSNRTMGDENVHEAEVEQEEEKPRERGMLFEKYPTTEVEVRDPSLAAYVTFGKSPYPNIFGRRKNKAYYDSHISIVERLANKIMRGGTGKKVGGKVIRREGKLQGRKIKVMSTIENAFDIINKQTGKNPVQVFVDALQNSAPIEDTTRVRYGGISYNVAVGISSERRVDVALRSIALAALINSFKNRKTLAEALANELILASTKSQDSYAIKKRIESERIAKRAR